MKFAAKEQQHHYKSLAKKLVPYALYAILPIALLRFYLYPSPPLSLQSPLPAVEQFGFGSPSVPIISSTSSYSLSSTAPPKAKGAEEGRKPKNSPKEEESGSGSESESESWCDYTQGKWAPSQLGPLYNGTSCGTIKDGQNCMSHGRPDVDYLYWRWEPRQCKLPRFDPEAFFNLMRNKHLAFVGDSMARNQLESLLCMLTSFSTPNLVYSSSSSSTNGVGGDDNYKFRRWHFPSPFNVTVSIYWSPFLVRGTEKSDSEAYNKLYLDSVDERWASDLDGIDTLVLSIGHWYLHPAIYFEGRRREDHVVLGCHFCGSHLNHTEIGFYDAFRKAYRTALKAVTDHHHHQQTKLGGAAAAGSTSSKPPIHVIVTTFSPHHFEGEWDKAGACPKTKPYEEGQGEDKVQLQGMDEEMRKIGVEQVEEANKKNSHHHQSSINTRSRVKMEALDITKLALLRPDGHPGPYMYPHPFANGFQERVQNDCVHWCMPGPIDAWNEIMLELIKQRWRTL